MSKLDGTPDDTLDANGNPIADTNSANDGNPPKTNSTPAPVTYTEGQYKGLQAVIARRDADIVGFKNTIIDLETKLLEAQHGTVTVTGEKTTLETQLTAANTKVTDLEGQVAALTKRLKYNDIIMKEFPDLAQAASFIPETPTDDEFRTKATEFRQALTGFANLKVQNVLAGSSIPVNQANTTTGEDDEDKAYRDVVALAGKPGKEKEYQEKYDHYQNILKAKQNQSTTG